MVLFCPRLLAASLLLGLGAGCAPEVVLATSPLDGGGSGGAGSGGAPAAGAGGTGGSGGDPVGAAGDGGAEPSSPPARLLADSVADFSFVQGQHGWLYGYDSGSLDTFAQMTRMATITLFEPPSGDIWNCWASQTAHWTQLFELGGHPNGTSTSDPSPPVLERAVRRWVSNYAGSVRITGEIAMLDTMVTVGTNNGVDASVVVDGTPIYSVYVPADDSAGLSYDLPPVTIAVDSTVDFVLDPHEGDDSHDLARFTGVIERVESAD